MSKADKLQSKLNKAYGIVASTLGREFSVYRSSTIDTPIQTENFIDNQLATFSKDKKYSSSAKSGLSIWETWIDGNFNNLFDIQNGDILHNDLNNETYIMVAIEPHLTHRSIKADSRITITRAGSTGYGNNDSTGFAPGNVSTDTTIGSNVPCQILETSSYGSSAYIPVASNSELDIPIYTIHLHDGSKEIQTRDLIIDENGNKSEVKQIEYSDIGVKLITRGII